MKTGKPLTLFVAVLFGLGLAAGCGSDPGGGGGSDGGGNGNNANANANGNNNNAPPDCPNGTDDDGDGYGQGCPAGDDCNDRNPDVHPGADEVCNTVDDDCDGQTDEGVLTPCGNCSAFCTEGGLGTDPFPMPQDDPNVEADGVGLDPNGDIILDQTNVDFNYLWIANCYDANNRGTVSKIDSVNVVEVARYYTVTCFGNPAYQQGQCLDVAGNTIQIESNVPSRTAVDYNFDVWVANRAFGGQASGTKIANSMSDCIDRNGNGVIDTSQDWDGNGQITLDCNGDSVPDDITVTCTNGLPPEFLGHDDECVLHTTNYGGINDTGRSMCLDAGDPYQGGAGNAWACTWTPGADGHNECYKLDGSTGQIMEVVDLPVGMHVYGCAVDGQGILWAAELDTGHLAFLDTANTSNVGPMLTSPYGGFYGIAVDSENSIWMGGWGTYNIIRYRPDRTTFSSLSQGTWSRIRSIEEGGIQHTRGIAADLRGWIWVASNNGYVVRAPQAIVDGDHSWAAAVALGATRINVALGGSMIGVGVDFDGHVWGMSYSASTATRIDLDQNGDPVDLVNNVFSTPVGLNPYTYSDFTGYGLRNFTRPRGTYRYLMEGCQNNRDTTWIRVEWNATTPVGTEIRLRTRTGDSPTDLQSWFGYWDTSPAVLADPPQGPLWPNPADYLQVEFELLSQDQDDTPILHDFNIVFDCSDDIPR